MKSAYKNAFLEVLLAWIAINNDLSVSILEPIIHLVCTELFDSVMQNSGDDERVELTLPILCFGEALRPRNGMSRQLHGAS